MCRAYDGSRYRVLSVWGMRYCVNGGSASGGDGIGIIG